jgi:AcrR family transcriptional regulator
MNPRPYRQGQRQRAVNQTRGRIVAAARELLASPAGFSGFTVDAVASQAGVARMTVYNQFGSKMGLLEALFDDLAARGLVDRLRAAFCQSDPGAALTGLVAAFAGFWSSERLVIRRIRALASIDADFELAVRARDERRREGLRVLVGRLAERYGKPSPDARPGAIDLLHTLTSFETFDSLAGPTRSPEEVLSLVNRLVHAVLELDAPGGQAGAGEIR